jgi:hypothetical protein
MPAIHATHPTRRTASAPFLFTSMRSVRRATAALIAGLGLLAGGGAVAQAGSGTGIGVISYWGTDAALYNQLPAGSLAVINPDSGLFVAAGQTTTLVPDLASWRDIVNNTAARGVKLLGYVPTGYFNHGCNAEGQCQTWARIEAQVAAYFAQLPAVTGIFFDEAAPATWSCSAFVTEYQKLRALVARYRPGAQVTFNAGVPDNCVVGGALAGETVVLFESSSADYTAQATQITSATAAARSKGVSTWHLVHSVATPTAMSSIVTQARQMQVNLVYVTDIGGNWQAGENTWGSLPSYWASEVSLLAGSPAGVNWGNLTKKLVNAASHLCLRGNASRIDQQACSGTSAWAMTVRSVGTTPYYQLKYGSKCATQASAASSAVSWATCSSTAANQMWSMKSAGGLVYFENRSSAQALTVSGGAAGSSASASNYTGALQQQFYFQ